MLESSTSNSSPNSVPDPSRAADGAATRLAVDSAPRVDSMPQHEPPPHHPLPGAWPAASAAPSVSAPGGEIPIIAPSDSLRRTDDNATRPLFGPDRWVSEQDFWETNTFIALSGRRSVPRPKTVPLKPPQRFRPVPRWRSYLLLVVVCLMIFATVAGIIAMSHFSVQAFGPAHPIATPVATHTTTPTHPTATPKKHK